MGFMEGFASGFANTFNAMETRRQANKQDAFKVAYDSYLRKQAKYDEDSKLDKGYIDSSKVLVAQAGKPPEAWEHAYELLKTGMSPDNVLKQLARTNFAIQAQPAMVEQPTDIFGGVDPTTASGLTMDNTANAAAGDMSAKTNPDLMGSIFGADGILNPEANKRRQLEGANKAVMNSTGMSQEEFNKVNGGYQPYTPTGNVQVAGTIEDTNPLGVKPGESAVGLLVDGSVAYGIPQADGSLQTFNGRNIPAEQLKDVVPQDMMKARTDAGVALDNAAKPYREKYASASTFTSGIMDLNAKVQANPNTIARLGNASVIVNELSNEFNSFISQFNQGGNYAQQEQNLVDKLTSFMVNPDANAEDVQIVASQAVSLAFALAKAQNTSGQITEPDFKRALSQILASNDAGIFESNAKRIVQDVASSINNERKAVSPFAISNANTFGIDSSYLDKDFIENLDQASRDWLEAQPVVKPGNKKTDEPEKRKTSEGVITEGMAAANPKFKDHVGKAFVIYDDGTMEIE